MTLPDHYATLSIDPAATADEVRAAYRRLVLHCHPDARAHAGEAEASARLRAVIEAHGVLSDDARRRRYDLQRRVVRFHLGQQVTA